jgi:hypothetical protein
MLHVFYDCISFRIYLYWTDNFVLKLANNFLTLQIQIAGKVVGCNLIGKRMKAWLEIGCTWQGNGMGIQIKKHKYKQNKSEKRMKAWLKMRGTFRVSSALNRRLHPPG